MMMNQVFTTAYGFAAILYAIILGLLYMGSVEDSAVCRGKN